MIIRNKTAAEKAKANEKYADAAGALMAAAVPKEARPMASSSKASDALDGLLSSVKSHHALAGAHNRNGSLKLVPRLSTHANRLSEGEAASLEAHATSVLVKRSRELISGSNVGAGDNRAGGERGVVNGQEETNGPTDYFRDEDTSAFKERAQKVPKLPDTIRNVFVISNDKEITQSNFPKFRVIFHKVDSKQDHTITRLRKKGDFLVDKRGHLRRFSGSQFLQVCWQHKRRKYQCKDCSFKKIVTSSNSVATFDLNTPCPHHIPLEMCETCQRVLKHFLPGSTFVSGSKAAKTCTPVQTQAASAVAIAPKLKVTSDPHAQYRVDYINYMSAAYAATAAAHRNATSQRVTANAKMTASIPVAANGGLSYEAHGQAVAAAQQPVGQFQHTAAQWQWLQNMAQTQGAHSATAYASYAAHAQAQAQMQSLASAAIGEADFDQQRRLAAQQGSSSGPLHGTHGI